MEWQDKDSRQRNYFPWTKELLSNHHSNFVTVKWEPVAEYVQKSLTWEEMVVDSQRAYECKVLGEEKSEDISRQAGPTGHDQSANEGLRERGQDHRKGSR